MMDQMNGFFPSRLARLDDLLKFTDLTPAAQKHLTKVYATLGIGILCSVFGVYAWLTFLRIPAILAGLISMGCLLGVMGTQAHFDEKAVATPKRLILAGTFAFSKGVALGGLIEAAQFIHPGVVTSALFLTFLIFASLTIAALVAKRRSWLFLGGILGTVTSWMLFGTLVNMFVRSKMLYDASLYIGLILFLGYILVDTQVIIEQVLNGKKDWLIHACELYVDMVGVFVRILVVLMKNADERDRRENRKRRN